MLKFGIFQCLLFHFCLNLFHEIEKCMWGQVKDKQNKKEKKTRYIIILMLEENTH